MKILKYIGIILTLLAGAWLVFCAISPTSLEVTRSITMNAPASIVFENVECLDRWPTWSPWSEMDPEMETTYSENPCGQGAWASWTGKKAGAGKQTIVERKANSFLKTELVFDNRGGNYSEWFFEEENESITVTWEFLGAETPFFMRPMNMLIEGMLVNSYEDGLKNLKEISETLVAKASYDVVQIEMPESKFLLTSAKMNPDHLRSFYGENFGKINAYLEQQGGEKNGYPTGLFHSWSSDTLVSMSAAIPVSSEIASSGEIEFWAYESGRGLQIDYYGAYRRVGKAHQAMAEHMQSNGLERDGAVREIYITDPSAEPDTSKWLTQIIYPVKVIE